MCHYHFGLWPCNGKLSTNIWKGIDWSSYPLAYAEGQARRWSSDFPGHRRCLWTSAWNRKANYEVYCCATFKGGRDSCWDNYLCHRSWQQRRAKHQVSLFTQQYSRQTRLTCNSSALDHLMNEGLIFTTIDDSHFDICTWGRIISYDTCICLVRNNQTQYSFASTKVVSYKGEY